jgi:tetratricopeptide (TPR) repeat protein
MIKSFEKSTTIPNLLRQRKYHEAIKIAREGTKYLPKYYYSWYILGSVYLYKSIDIEEISGRRFQKLSKTMVNAFDESYKLDPEFWFITDKIGYIFIILKNKNQKEMPWKPPQNVQEINICCRTSLNLEAKELPNKILSGIYCALSMMSLKKGMIEQSILEAKKAVILDPKTNWGYWQLCLICKSYYKTRPLLNEIKKWVLNQPDNIMAYEISADCLFSIGEYKEAGELYKRAAIVEHQFYLMMKRTFNPRKILYDIKVEIYNLSACFLFALNSWDKKDFNEAQRHINQTRSKLIMSNALLWRVVEISKEERGKYKDRLANVSNTINLTFEIILKLLKTDIEIDKICKTEDMKYDNYFRHISQFVKDMVIYRKYISKIIDINIGLNIDYVRILILLIIAKTIYLSIIYSRLKKIKYRKWSVNAFFLKYFENVFTDSVILKCGLPKNEMEQYYLTINKEINEEVIFNDSCDIARIIFRKLILSSGIESICALETYVSEIAKYNSFKSFIKKEANLRRRLLPSFAFMGGNFTNASQGFYAIGNNIISGLDKITGMVKEIRMKTTQAMGRREGKAEGKEPVVITEGEQHKSVESRDKAGEPTKYKLSLKITDDEEGIYKVQIGNGKPLTVQELHFAQTTYLGAARVKRTNGLVNKNTELFMPLPKKDPFYLNKAFEVLYPDLIQTSGDNIWLGIELTEDQFYIDDSVLSFESKHCDFAFKAINEILRWRMKHENKKAKEEDINDLKKYKFFQYDQNRNLQPNDDILSAIKNTTIIVNALKLMEWERKIRKMTEKLEILRNKLQEVLDLLEALDIFNATDVNSWLRGDYAMQIKNKSIS